MPTPILPLASFHTTLATVGGKGLNLARLARAGFSGLPGFLVPTDAYRALVVANDLQDVIRDALAASRLDDSDAPQAASAAIRARFATGAIPADLTTSLTSAYADLSRPAVAARSSATAGDLPDLSFAGQQDPYPNVVGDEALLQAVVNCWSSLWTARALGYHARNDIPQDEVALAVVVQEMVHIADPEKAPDAIFQQGAPAAEQAIDHLAEGLRHTLRGRIKARFTRFAAGRVRALAGLREAPKFFIIRIMGRACKPTPPKWREI
jgi:hypothetical protein